MIRKKPQCDKCNGRDFLILDLSEVEYIPASQYFKPSYSSWDNIVTGIVQKKAICKICGAEYAWEKDYSLPVMD